VSKKLNSQFYLIVDHDTAEVAQIQYVTVNGSKMYTTETETNLHFVQISGVKGKTIDAIAQPPSECDTNGGNTSDSVFVQGTDGTLTVKPGVTITFPKTLSGTDNEVDHSQSSPIYIASTVVVSFDSKQTPLSNGNGETLDAVLGRISAILEGQGFQKSSEKVKSSRYPVKFVGN
jgi:hypothetical protein